MKLDSSRQSRLAWTVYVASQGSYEDVKKFTDKLKPPERERDSKDLLKDFKNFKKGAPE